MCLIGASRQHGDNLFERGEPIMPYYTVAVSRVALIALCLLCCCLPSTGAQAKVYSQIPTSVNCCMGLDPAADAPRHSVFITDEGRVGIVRKAEAGNPKIAFF